MYTYTNGFWFSTDTIVDIIPDTIPTDTIPVVIPDTIPNDTIPVIIPDTTDTIPVDSLEGLIIPRGSKQGKLVLRNGVIYILTPEGSYYTLLGLPGRKEEIQ